MNQLQRVIICLGFGLALALAALVALSAALTPARAQQSEIFVDKRLGRSNPVVYVGEYLTFTIQIENRTNFTVTTLPLSDTFNTDVLAFVDATPMPDSVDAGNGRLDWNDLTTTFGDLPPGATVWVVVGFIAEHPAPAVVNRAEVHDALSSGGQIGGGGDDSNEGSSIGGSTPVDKEMVGNVEPEVGQPLTFTIRITNSGYATLTVVPLFEDYDPEFLQFSFAVPQPDSVDEVAGQLYWSDLTTWFGDVGSFSSIQITAVFTALAPIALTTNSASVSGSSDWYGNDLDGGADQVPITIVGPGQQATATPTTVTATATATSAATQTPGAGDTPAAATSTAVAATATPEATTALVRPETLPATGIPPTGGPPWALLALAAALPVAGWWLLRRRHL
ncbi:MAG: hypothetical protein BroJett015_36330 [Chloroflexota bacterium]|nr:hypothetical protein [Ardenticatenaceae bacterium]GIK57970.1 MAG: hypothetical protein BroJett015_36330 [Chloroflexota bacterium]